MIIIIIIIITLINITVTGILEKSSGGEFQAKNSSDMVYPYSSSEVMNKPFQGHFFRGRGFFDINSGLSVII